jgi:hypothetical protein
LKLKQRYMQMLIIKSSWLVLTIIWALSILVIAGAVLPVKVKAQNASILTIVLRTSLGEPLEGVTTEVLSYDWGLEVGQAYSVIAKGETDKNGVVAFDSTPWPFSGYRVKFTPTGHTRPAKAYFLPDSDNQYRGYPGISTGGVTETQKFVLSGSDGLTYNDLSADGQLPEYQRDPVGGMLNPRVSVMPGQDFLASVAAATSTAEARGEPTPTIPPPAAASPRPGQTQAALTMTPGTSASQASWTANTTSVVSTAIGTNPPQPQPTVAIGKATPAQRAAVANQADSSKPKTESNTLISALLAIAGVTALVVFWIFRFRIYRLFGIETVSEKRLNKYLPKKKPVVTPKPGPREPKP